MTEVPHGHPILAELFRHNLWANLTLIDLCLTLPEEIWKRACLGRMAASAKR